MAPKPVFRENLCLVSSAVTSPTGGTDGSTAALRLATQERAAVEQKANKVPFDCDLHKLIIMFAFLIWLPKLNHITLLGLPSQTRWRIAHKPPFAVDYMLAC